MKLLKITIGVLAVVFFPLFVVGVVFGVARTAFMAGDQLVDAVADDIAEKKK